MDTDNFLFGNYEKSKHTQRYQLCFALHQSWCVFILSFNLVVGGVSTLDIDDVEMLMKFITYSLQVLGCDANQSSQTSQHLLLRGRELNVKVSKKAV